MCLIDILYSYSQKSLMKKLRDLGVVLAHIVVGRKRNHNGKVSEIIRKCGAYGRYWYDIQRLRQY